MDRVAAALQRDGVAARRRDRDLRHDLDRATPRSSSARCAPASRSRRWRRRSTPQSLRVDARRCAARKLLFVDAAARDALGAVERRAVPRVALDGSARRARAFDDLARARRRSARSRSSIEPELAVQHHLFVGHDRHAQGHRAVACACAGRTCSAAPTYGYGPRRGDAARHAAVLEHDAGRASSRRSRSAAPWC